LLTLDLIDAVNAVNALNVVVVVVVVVVVAVVVCSAPFVHATVKVGHRGSYSL
jgi:hypothetical protein